MCLEKVSYLCTVILIIQIMVQDKKQLNSKPKFAEVIIGDNEAKKMRGYGSRHLCNRQKGS